MDGTGIEQSAEAFFFDLYGDEFDDRVAEVVDELLADRIADRNTQFRPLSVLPLIALVVIAVAGVSVLLQRTPLAVAAVWLAAAVMICGCVTRFAFRRRGSF
ncbi:hypothetical protein [Fodinicola feengrottensis]|uniref:hypothetical protein n=1 Tax=Fodinicola feengrottensis TaxID=435914 RepID=UPI0013D8C7F8|nr:hypothetical protein [Fodinicola feengrottensis]